MSSTSRKPLMTPKRTLNETVILYVGPKRKKYIVHKKVLCGQSEFFNAGFNKGSEEAANGEMYLPEDDPATCADLIEYFYRGTLPYADKTTTRPMQELYCLAEKIRMPILMDKLMDAIMLAHKEKNNFDFGADRTRNIYENTHSTSKLRLYASAMLAFNIHYDFNSKVDFGLYLPLSQTCPELFADVFRIIYTHRLSFVDFDNPLDGVKYAFGRCGFHVHGSDGVCYRKVLDFKTIEFSNLEFKTL
ncbi:hypothetical protein BTUL_0034g00050 [Botrytis tulipae]|uniref:BTB domain-containing protein n=1 Tax=Botrytis tulipae TaxID=87230 RepID=A0A4Z1ETZ5_9HELO|nr:hypothetical protein BTUL_0034g00050 [Botrytis tulipae]